VRVPIACTLTADAAGDRVEEWRQFLAQCTGAVERMSPERLRMRLNDSPGTLEVAVDLARREKACCAFFDFSIEVEADALWLSARVPAEASNILDDFASLLG
jgi:hypothetical protein